MADSNTFNMVELLKKGLEKEVKNAVTETIVTQELKEFEEKIREKIKPLVNKVSFKGINSIKDCMRVREELHVFLHWDDEELLIESKI